ncbi:hypothetical protein LRY65_03575 [Candidatus Woesebacteria bacterium]|nr:hypothetical protein [Candidatus Woesebacteria bacterium]
MPTVSFIGIRPVDSYLTSTRIHQSNTTIGRRIDCWARRRTVISTTTRSATAITATAFRATRTTRITNNITTTDLSRPTGSRTRRPTHNTTVIYARETSRTATAASAATTAASALLTNPSRTRLRIRSTPTNTIPTKNLPRGTTVVGGVYGAAVSRNTVVSSTSPTLI